MTTVTTVEAPNTALPGDAVFVGWDFEKQAFHLEDKDEVITIADLAAPPISGISTEPVGRRTPDGRYTVAYLAEPEEEVFSVVTIAFSSDSTVDSIRQTAPTEYGHGEALLATLRGALDQPEAHRFLIGE